MSGAEPPTFPPPPAGRLTQRSVLIGLGVVIALVLAAGLVVAVPRLTDDDQPVAVATPSPSTTPSPEPSPSPTPTPSPSPPPEPSPSPSPSPPQLSGFEEVAAEVAGIRGLPIPGALDVRVVTPAAIGDVYSELAFEEIDPAAIARDQRLLVALRLLEPGVDLRAAIEALYREQVLGLYDPEDDVLYIGSDAADSGAPVGADDLSPYKQVTAAHEINHALQDGAYDLEGIRDLATEESDDALALLSLIEGDAVVVQQTWASRFQTAEERADAQREGSQGSSSALADAPPYLRESLIFPYTFGVDFVAALLQQGGFAAVDAAFRAPPTTTEHILHPDRYLAGEGEVEVAVPPAPGPEWSAPHAYDFGEFDLRQLYLPLGSDTALRAADGWAGGRVVEYERGPDTAVGLVMAGDDPAQTAEICDGVAPWWGAVAGGTPSGQPGVLRGDRDVLAFRCTADRVLLGIAPDEAVARMLAGI